MADRSVTRKLAAILAADVVGYSRLMEADEETTARALHSCRKLIDGSVTDHSGRVFNSAGDSVVAEFASPVKAVRCAVEIQQNLADWNSELSPDRRMQFRIGVNLGDVLVEGDNLLGTGVNEAARLEGLAEPSGIYVSGTIFDHVKGKVDLSFTYLGDQLVKNISEPLRVYSVSVDKEKDATDAVPTSGRAFDPVTTPTDDNDDDALLGINLSLPDKPSIAVLPFVNMSADPEQEFFSDGITEDIITALSKISDLLIVARNSTFTYKGQAVDVKQVGREQGVRYILEGSVRKAGSRVRITAQLIDATTGHHLWAERYDRDLQDIFAVQDEITSEVVLALDVRLTQGEQARFWSSGTKNLKAWECCRQALDLANLLTEETRPEARQLFKKAIDLDPDYAVAWIGLGWIHFHEADIGIGFGTQVNREDALEQAVACAKKALELNPSYVDAYAQLGMCHLSSGEHDQAVAMAEKIAGLAPNHAEKLAIAAAIHNKSGEPRRAFGLIKKAMRLCPIYPNWYLYVLGTACRLLGWNGDAARVFEAAIARNPDYIALHVGLAATLGELGREADAKKLAAEILRREPSFSIRNYVAGLSYRDPAESTRFEISLREAGLPE